VRLGVTANGKGEKERHLTPASGRSAALPALADAGDRRRAPAASPVRFEPLRARRPGAAGRIAAYPVLKKSS